MKARGLGRIYDREGTFWIQYYFRGRLFRESSGSKVRSAAVKLLRKRQAEMGKGRLLGPDVEKTTFEDLSAMLVRDYEVNGRRSIDRARRSVAHLREFFGMYRAIEITSDRLDAYVTSRMGEKAAPATIRLELAALKRMFRLGVRAGKVAHRPEFPSIEVRNTRTGFFEEAELQAVLAKLDDHLRPLVQFLALTGWRVSEARSLCWSQVDHAGGVVRLEVGSTKNGAGRVFPFASLPQLATLLRAQRERTSALERESGVLCPWVFHRRGKPIRSFHHAWVQACARAGVPGRLVHDLRRSAARDLVRSGVPERTAMVLLGHKTRSIFDRYHIVRESDLAESVQKLAAFKSAGPAEPRRVVALSGPADVRTSTERAQSGSLALDAEDAPTA